MRDDIVIIKGGKDGVVVSLSPTDEWLTITGELANRIDEKSGFFSGANLVIELGERPVPKHELSGLKALLERRGLSIGVIVSGSKTTIDAAHALNLNVQRLVDENAEEAAPIPAPEDGSLGILIRNTVRSGRAIHSAGHVVIYGDVNPGAEIVAGGDVFVWGKLRGNVHAGAYGDESAVVCALDLQPNQLRIAGYIVTSPTDKRRKIKPEKAFIRNHQITVESWND